VRKKINEYFYCLSICHILIRKILTNVLSQCINVDIFLILHSSQIQRQHFFDREFHGEFLLVLFLFGWAVRLMFGKFNVVAGMPKFCMFAHRRAVATRRPSNLLMLSSSATSSMHCFASPRMCYYFHDNRNDSFVFSSAFQPLLFKKLVFCSFAILCIFFLIAIKSVYVPRIRLV
jgi:hypothetical protein